MEKKVEVTEEVKSGLSPYEMFETNKDWEQKGIWLNYGAFEILVGRAGGSNFKFVNLFNERMRPHRREESLGILDDRVLRKVLAECYADAAVFGWKGNVVDKQKKPMAFNRENVIKLLTDLPDMFADIRKQAGDEANFLAVEIESISKN